MQESNFLSLFVIETFRMDTNNSNSFKYDSSCSYSNQGDCAGCCQAETVWSR